MTAQVVVLLNPLDVSRRRRALLADDTPLLEWIRANEPAGGALERRIFVNGAPCEDLTYRTHPGDEVLVAFAPAGAVVGPYILKAVIGFVIGFLLQKLFSPQKPAAGAAPQASQVYGIAQPKNGARLGQPIPVGYGSFIALPDFAAQPYTFFRGNDQFLHAVLCLGLGEYDVAEMLLGQTQASTLSDDIRPKWYVFLPAAHASTFGIIEGQKGIRENVVTSSAVGDQELVAPNMGGVLTPSTWMWALSGFARTYAYPGGLDLSNAGSLSAKLAALPTNPPLGTAVFCTLGYDGSTYTSGTYTATAYDASQNPPAGALVPPPTYSQAGMVKWLGYFAACKPGQHGSLLELDFVFPNGLYAADASGNLQNCTVNVTIEAQPIDDTGANAGALQTFNWSYMAKDNTPQRQTVQYPVPSGRYKVRAQRTSNSDGKATTADHVIWAGLKFQLDPLPRGAVVYGNVTLIAVELKATNGIASEAASSMRFRCTRRLPPLGDANSPTAPTSNPADAFCDVLLAAYGGGRPRNGDELDLVELAFSRALWTGANGFNAIFDQASTVWEALGLTVQTVHAAPLPVGSRMSLIHDGIQPVRAQVFTDENIVAGSLTLNYQFDTVGTPAGVRVTYRDWQSFSEATYSLPIDAPDYQTVDLFGCTDAGVAAQHAALLQAKRAAQRATLQFATELEGLQVLPGDRIGVASSTVQWGQSARVAEFHGSTVTLDTELTWTPGAQHAIYLRDETGFPWRVLNVQRGAGDRYLVLPAAPPFPLVGLAQSEEPTQLAFGVVDAELTDWTVTKMTPNGATVQIEAVNYAPQIYTGAAAFTRELPPAVLLEASPGGAP